MALAQRVQELSRYRSDFFGRLRADPRRTGPTSRWSATASCFRPRCSSPPASDEIGAIARGELDKLADAILELEGQIPPEINWVIRVDGHTDVRPIQATSRFRSNWELSASRAIAVVRYLIDRGIKPEHLVAAGFGEFQPLDPARERGSLPAQPPHRAEADGAVSAIPRSAQLDRLRREEAAARAVVALAAPELAVLARLRFAIRASSRRST